MNNLETAVMLGLALLSLYSYIRLLFFKKSRYYKDTSVVDDVVDLSYPSPLALYFGPIGVITWSIISNIWSFIWQQILNIVEAIFLFDKFYVKEGKNYRIVFLSALFVLVIFFLF